MGAWTIGAVSQLAAERRLSIVVALLGTIACRSTEPNAANPTTTGAPTGTAGVVESGARLDTSSSTDAGLSTETIGGSGTTGDGSPPPAPTLVSPVDEATDVGIETELCWDLVEDPDGDAVRYRITVDDVELKQGVTGEDGFVGPCAGPFNLLHERTYRWHVRAFEVDDPSRFSNTSGEWRFTTGDDGISTTVFEDDFARELGWQVRGDASTGAWVRGLPDLAHDGTQISQLGRCASGSQCYFTGLNPAGQADQADVSGGSTVLTSPPFDLQGAAMATVRLQRFFYKSEVASGPGLFIELLVPDDGGPDAFVAYPLEQLEVATGDQLANVWTPVEYAACDAPMRDGSRLQITATDEGLGILEAAIDSVSVHAYQNAIVCEGGEGGICDPSQGNAACPNALLCCARNVLNDGVYRCGPAVAGLDFDAPPASVDDPGNGMIGCDAPDLLTDPTWVEAAFTNIFVEDDTCELLEGCVGGTGWRTIMRFTTAVPNIGSRDLVLGIPANNPDAFHYSDCHAHYHLDNFANYALLDDDNVVASGHKQAFCMLDTISWAWPFELSQFDCANQGISRGFTDHYESGLPCQ
ncbi:MAG: hypothetical protein JKY37_22785 [Nannocystaceae bacterium]|nr:hypothetical protein [Nannocystaceae bacterium]